MRNGISSFVITGWDFGLPVVFQVAVHKGLRGQKENEDETFSPQRVCFVAALLANTGFPSRHSGLSFTMAGFSLTMAGFLLTMEGSSVRSDSLRRKRRGIIATSNDESAWNAFAKLAMTCP